MTMANQIINWALRLLEMLKMLPANALLMWRIKQSVCRKMTVV